MIRCTNRSVSFVERVELEFHGNHFCQALSLGDVDGDGLNEFIIGSVDGTLAIYKGNGSKKPWRIAKGLGTITCTGTGDIFNTGKIQLVCVNAAGLCRIYSVYRYVSPRKGSSSSSTSYTDSKQSIEIQPKCTQELHPNIKVILIGNIAPDGKEELFVGRTDRVVNVYRWNSEAKSLVLKNVFTFEGQIGSLSVSVTAEGTSQLLISQTGGTYIPLWYKEVTKEDKEGGEDPSNRTRNESNLSRDKDSLVSISVSGDHETTPSSRRSFSKVETNSGTVGLTLSDSTCDERNKQKTTNEEGEEPPPPPHAVPVAVPPPTENVLTSHSSSSLKAQSSTSTGSASLMDHYQLHPGAVVGVVQRSNPLSSTEIVGDLRSRMDLQEETRHSSIVALCTLGGAIRFLKDEKKIWEHQVDHNLFSISKLDVTNDGEDEMIVCAWDGTTYIMDQSRNVVRYKFEDNVCAFTAGHFGFSQPSEGFHNKPCLIYTTFFNKIFIYHNITLSSIAPANLITSLQEQESFEKLKTFTSKLTDPEKAKVFRNLLYQ